MSSDNDSFEEIENDSNKENQAKDTKDVLKIELSKDLLRSTKNKIKKGNPEGFIEMTYILHDLVYKHFGGKEFEKSNKFSKKMSKTREGFKAKKGVKQEGKCTRNTKYTTKNIKLIRLAIFNSLRYLPKFLEKLFKNKKHPHLDIQWKTMKNHVARYISSLTIALSHVKHDDLYLFLNHIKLSFIYMQTFCDISKIFLKSLINCLIDENVDIRKTSFSCIIKFIQTHKKYHRMVFKKIHEKYIKHYKPSIHHDTSITDSLLTNFIDLVKFYPDYAYQFIYEDFRKLAQNVRTAISVNTKTQYQDILNWRTISLYHMYAHVISKSPNLSNIHSLSFPLIELLFSILRISENPIYFPAQLHLLRATLSLYSSTCYIPLLPYILKILLSKELTESGAKSSEKSPIIKYLCHIPANLNHTQIAKDSLFDEALDLLLEFLDISSCSIAFPEIVVIPLNSMKLTAKTTKIHSVSSQLKIVIKKCEETSKNITEARNHVDFSPNDTEKIRQWEMSKLGNSRNDPKFNTLVEYSNKWRANRAQIIGQLVDAHKNDHQQDDS